MENKKKEPEEDIPKEEINKIYEYNRLWLTDQKTFFEGFLSELKDAFFKAELDSMSVDQIKKNRNRSLPSYVKGSLFDSAKSLELKNQLQFKLFGVNVLKEFLQLNNYCVVTDFFRYQPCSEDNISRPLIGFFTTKDYARKLRYLDKQEFKYSYISIDYTSVEFAEKKSNQKFMRSDYNKFKFPTKAENFDNFLYQEKGNKFKNYVIPTLLDFTEFNDIKFRNLEKLKKEFNKDTMTKLEKYERYEKLGTIKPEQKKEKEELEKKLEEVNIRERSITEMILKNYYTVESDYYYKQAFLNFREQVNKKVNVKIDLTDWSYCIVLQPTWCDESYEPIREVNEGLKFFQPFEFKKEERLKEKIGFPLFNSQIEKSSVDDNLIYFLTEIFKQPPVKVTEPLLRVGDLDSFDRLSKTFEKYPNGGYWIKKIEKQGKKYIERVVGPYEKERALKKAKIMKNILPLEDAKTARVYSFKELICDDNLLELNNESGINNYVKQNDRFHVPPGAQLFCISHRISDLIYLEKDNLTSDIINYNNYAYNKGIKYLATINHLIYYDPENPSSLQKAGEMKNLLSKKNSFTPAEFLWLNDAIYGRENKRGKEPEEIPFKISGEISKKGVITYEELKKINELIDSFECGEEKMLLSYENFKKRFSPNFVENFRNSDYEIKTEITMNIVMNQEDNQPKKVKIIKDFDNKYHISMLRRRKNFNDINLISLNNIDGCSGYLNLKFNSFIDKTWEISKLELFSGDEFFNNEVVLIVFIMFVAKVFWIEKNYFR